MTFDKSERGNHFHTRKIERFFILEGKASIKLRKIDSEEIFEFIISEDSYTYIDIPIWYTHSLTNIGKGQLISLFWINEFYNQANHETYILKV